MVLVSIPHHATKNFASLYREYETVSALVQIEFDRNARQFQNHAAPNGKRGLQCGRGCSSCCSQLFRITPLEAAYISRYVRGLPAEKQAELRQRAQAYLPRRKQLLEGRAQERLARQVEGRLPLEGLRLPCPALEADGSCAVYEARPLVCRKFGMPLYNPLKPRVVGACELNFAGGEEIVSSELVEKQTRIFERWQAVKQAMNGTGPPEPRELSVGDALLEDFGAGQRSES